MSKAVYGSKRNCLKVITEFDVNVFIFQK